VETEIGTTLREARIRHHIDLIEIEEKTKIRVRYLRALENEEWDVLPGPTYTRSFIRTYASFLGLDGERLADDFRRLQEDQIPEPGGREPRPRPQRPVRSGDGLRIPGWMIAAGATLALGAVLLVLGLTAGGDGGSPAKGTGHQAGKTAGKHKGTGAQRKPGVSIKLTARAEVWVCVLAADGTAVVNGQILQPGVSQGPFHSGKFELAFGNGSVDLTVNGKPFKVQNTPSPVGYAVTPKGTQLLQPGTRPNCT
jgi:cytoskeleton protein RodZ